MLHIADKLHPLRDDEPDIGDMAAMPEGSQQCCRLAWPAWPSAMFMMLPQIGHVQVAFNDNLELESAAGSTAMDVDGSPPRCRIQLVLTGLPADQRYMVDRLQDKVPQSMWLGPSCAVLSLCAPATSCETVCQDLAAEAI